MLPADSPSPEHLTSRLRILALSSPPQTALFYARIWHALSHPSGAAFNPSIPAPSAEVQAHEAVHVLALAFLATDEPYSALHLVRDTAEHYTPATAAAYPSAASSSRHAAKNRPSVGCLGCATLVARACETVGRYSEGAKVLERAMRQHPDADAQLPQMQQAPSDTTNLLLARMSQRSKESDIAAEQYLKALSSNVWLWEAYTAMCDLGVPPPPEQTFPTPLIAARSSSTAPLRASSYPGALPLASSSSSSSTHARAVPSANPRSGNAHAPISGGQAHGNAQGPRDSNPFGARSTGPSAAGTSRYGARGLTGAGAVGGGMMANMTPGAGYDDSILGPGGVGGAGRGGVEMMFTPDGASGGYTGAGVGGEVGGAGRARQGMGRVQMLGGTLWDTPSSVGDTTFPSVQPIRRVLPSRSTTAPSTAISTPATGTALPSGPPAMKRARGPAHAVSAPSRGEYETPVNTNGSSSSNVAPARPGHAAHGRIHDTTAAADPLRRGQRDLKSIEPNADADLPPRRSTRLKVPPIKPSVRVTKPSGKVNADTRVKGEVQDPRSRSATATSVSGMSDMTSPPLDSATSVALSAASSVMNSPTEASLHMFDTASAISHLDALSPALQSSPLALIVIAIAFYEQADYIRSRRAFASLFTAEPYRLQGVHLYSTLLWHLADAPALSALAQGAVAVTKSRPEVWIAVGNCMSLGGDHEGALRCFKRATQVGGTAGMLGHAQAGASGAVRPGMGGCTGEAAFGGQDRATAYAYTLAGYEAVELEEYERAVRMYRLAIRTDARLYNAWYGLGQAFMKMTKLKYAEHHFRRAVEINPSNPVLLCCVGQVLEAQEDNRAALQIYTRASLLPSSSTSTPNSVPPLVQFKRIRMLIVLDQMSDALALLEPLARDLPDEAQIQLLLGKCLLAVGRKAEGVQALTEARELVPRLGAKVGRLIGGEESEEEDD